MVLSLQYLHEVAITITSMLVFQALQVPRRHGIDHIRRIDLLRLLALYVPHKSSASTRSSSRGGRRMSLSSLSLTVRPVVSPAVQENEPILEARRCTGM